MLMRYRLLFALSFLPLIACTCPRSPQAVVAPQADGAHTATSADAHVTPTIPGVTTSTTIIFPRFSVGTSTGTVEAYVRMIEGKTILASSEDQASIEQIMAMVRRANLDELRTVMDDDKEPPIAHPLIRMFWYAVIYRARGFLEFPVCEDRVAHGRRMFERTDSATASMIIASAWYLRTRYKGPAYACRPKDFDGPFGPLWLPRVTQIAGPLTPRYR